MYICKRQEYRNKFCFLQCWQTVTCGSTLISALLWLYSNFVRSCVCDMGVNSSLCSVDAAIIATVLTFSVYQLFFIIQDGFVLKCVFYIFFALSSICARYSTDLYPFTTILSCFLSLNIFRQTFSRLFTAVVNGISLDLCLCYRNQDSADSIPCDILHDYVFQKKN